MQRVANRLRRIAAFVLGLGLVAVGCAKAPTTATNVGSPPHAPRQPAPVPPELRDAEAAWRSAREGHPLHFQGVFSHEHPDGRVSVVVTEPPPHARLPDIKGILAASAISEREWPVGFDGRLTDVIATLSPTPGIDAEDALRSRLADLHQYLFHSTYRAKVYDAFAAPDTGPVELDLAVPLGAIPAWLQGAQRRFVGLAGDEVDAPGLARHGGVYRAQDIGLVVWSVPDGSDLCGMLPQVREFALETDLLLGGVHQAASSLLIGRARSSSLERVPPLRTEMLLRLTGADSQQLSQSYERTNFFSGKLRDGRDWAPILLSSDLIDTELGGLLNITDQLLKGWSLNGIVQYAGFKYAQPTQWAGALPLSEELKVNSVTFNWNTSGALADLTLGGARFMTSPRTGALPIAYLPEGVPNPSSEIAAIEERNQNFFASQNDPNLVRVVSYNTFYQVAQAFNLRAGSKCATTPSADTRAKRSQAEKYLEGLLLKLIDGGTAPELAAERDENAERVVEQLVKWSRQVVEQAGPAGKDEFVHYVAGVTSTESVKAPQQAMLDFSAQVGGQLSNWAMQGAMAKLFDRDAVQREYTRLARRESQGFVATPSVVVSHIPDRVERVVIDGRLAEVTTKASGGHNLRNVPGVLRVDANSSQAQVSSRSTFDYSASIPPGHLWIDPKVMQRVQKAVQDGRMSSSAAAQALDDAARTPARLPTLKLPTGSDPGVGFDVPRTAASNTPNPVAFEVQYRQGEASMYAARTPDGKPLEGGSTRGLLAELTSRMRATPERALLLELQGFPEQRAKNFALEVVRRVTGEQAARRVVFVADRGGLMRRFRSWLDRFGNTTHVEVSLLEGTEMPTYRVSMPGQPFTLWMRIHGTLKSVAKSSFAEKLGALFRTPNPNQSLADRFDSFCRTTQISAEVSVTEDGPPPDTHVRLEPQPGVAQAASDG